MCVSERYRQRQRNKVRHRDREKWVGRRGRNRDEWRGGGWGWERVRREGEEGRRRYVWGEEGGGAGTKLSFLVSDTPT